MTTRLSVSFVLNFLVVFWWIPAEGVYSPLVQNVCDPQHPQTLICQEKNAECTFTTSKQNVSCTCRDGYEMQEGICEITEAYCRKSNANVTYTGTSVICDCGDDHFFDYSTSQCHAVDLCPFMSCKGKYEECKGSKCICKTGYERSNAECRPKNYCLIDSKCGGAKCEPGPSEDPKRVRCYCDSGSVLIREKSKVYCKLIRCEIGSLNACDQLCSYTPDGKSTKCGCFPGFSLKSDGITCEISDNQKCAFNSCPPEAVCVEDDGKRTCHCKSGFINNSTCVDLCSAGKITKEICPSGCVPKADGFQCICTGKYRLSNNQITCEERPMCMTGERGHEDCQQSNKECIENPNLEKGYECGKCLLGFSPYNGTCIDLCSLPKYKEFCAKKGGTCDFVNVPVEKVHCNCPPLFTYDNVLGCVFAKYSYTAILHILNDSQNDNDETFYNNENSEAWPRLHQGIITSLTTLFGPVFSKINIINCRADDPVLISKIEMQMNFPSKNLLKRLTYQEMCKKDEYVPNDFCFIPPFLRLRKDSFSSENSFRVSNACDMEYGGSFCPYSAECVVENIGFACKCKNGFEANPYSIYASRDGKGEIEICQDINECKKDNPCPNGTTCKNTIGSFECECNAGLVHISSHPEENTCVDICDTMNCTHGACIEFHLGGYYCECDDGYSGKFCDLPMEKNSNAVMVLAIFEGLVLILVIPLLIYIFWKKIYQQRNANTNAEKGTTRKDISPPLANLRSIPVVNPNGPKRNAPSNYYNEDDDAIYADCEYVNETV